MDDSLHVDKHDKEKNSEKLYSMIEFLQKPLKGMDYKIFQVIDKNMNQLSDSTLNCNLPNRKFSYVQIKVKQIDDLIGALQDKDD